MKYIIIPLFRLVTLPVILLYIFCVIMLACARDLWTWRFDELKYLMNKKSFHTYERYNECGGNLIDYYEYKTLWSYIINKKTYANE